MTLCSDDALYQRLSNGARERFDKIFTYDKMIDNTLTIYNQLWKKQQ